MELSAPAKHRDPADERLRLTAERSGQMTTQCAHSKAPAREGPSASRHLDHEPIRLLQVRNDVLGEVCTDVTIDDAVVEREAQVHDLTDHDLVPAHDWLLLDGVDAQNADFGIVDDRRGEQPAELAQ